MRPGGIEVPNAVSAAVDGPRVSGAGGVEPVGPPGHDVRRAWLEARRTGIGGSDAAAILGHGNPRWTSRYKVWAQKRGLLPLEDEENERQEAGRRLEPVIVQWYRDVTGRIVETGAAMIRSKAHPFMLATVDGMVARGGADKDVGGLECKNVDAWYFKEWADGAPLQYQIQAQHYMAVTGRAWWSFAVLFGGNKFRWYDFERNDAFVEKLIREEELFWGLVTEGVAPAVDPSEATQETLAVQYSKTDGAAIELPMPDSDDMLSKWNESVEWSASAERAVLLAENQIRRLMGHAERGVVPGRGTFTLKARKGATKRTLRWTEENPK